ncbi:sel1 repeat family protein [Variovorax sp. JS1663]|uniref:sel1 repeat family protein n=1 Tax=Variovorax sp. JS1663 TaxID=1851577 RepID=UPI000B34946C|nr:sel1 repeat family protein [Variovorax sp. JS1663]OUM00108.1 hypothetical protein A8M77_23285 [Variovorax sp. JS1663]
MTKRPLPSPLESATPIIVPRPKLSETALRELRAVFDAIDEGRFDQAAKLASEALDRSSRSIERRFLGATIAYVDRTAVLADHVTPALLRLRLKAVDSGFHEFAYNAANHLMEAARTRADYKAAARYYKIAMAYDGEPRTQAAAHVNFCPIVRDGLITGEKDWPGAVEIYEQAARMGLIKGMFNAGNVLLWLTGEGRTGDHGTRAASWFAQAIDHFERRLPRLDMESDAQLEEVITNCRLNLAGMDIDGTYGGADAERGIAVVQELARQGHPVGKDYLRVGLSNRLQAIAEPPGESPGANWRIVLTALPGREMYAASLWCGSTPDLLLRQCTDGVRLGNPEFGEDNCMISIAVNALDEGLIIAQDASPHMRYVEVGSGLRMPFVKEENLLDLGIVLA